MGISQSGFDKYISQLVMVVHSGTKTVDNHDNMLSDTCDGDTKSVFAASDNDKAIALWSPALRWFVIIY